MYMNIRKYLRINRGSTRKSTRYNFELSCAFPSTYISNWNFQQRNLDTVVEYIQKKIETPVDEIQLAVALDACISDT